MLRKITLTVMIFFVFLSCDKDIKRIVPPQGAVNRVTDFYMFDDNSTFLFLTSNMNRKYDYGMLVMMKLDPKGNAVYVDSVTLPSLAGKMAVDEKAGFVYVTSRDLHGIVRVKVSKKQGVSKLSFTDTSSSNYPEVLKTEKEPYAVELSLDKSKLYTSHLFNGELTVVDLKAWKKIDSFKLKYGVTDFKYYSNLGCFIASHRSSGFITLADPVQVLDDLYVEVREIEMDLPTNSYDIRSLGFAADGKSIYASFRNVTKDSDDKPAPQLLKLRVKKTGKNKNFIAQVIKSIPLKGSLGELSVLPYTKGSGDNIYTGELVFVTSPEAKKLYIVDSGNHSVIEEINYSEGCEPYQVYAKKTGATKGTVFVSCYVQDKIIYYDVDISQPYFIREKGVIK